MRARAGTVPGARYPYISAAYVAQWGRPTSRGYVGGPLGRPRPGAPAEVGRGTWQWAHKRRHVLEHA
eukprot:11201271-Lingulodinium_polyedra.AAC.1